MAMRSLWWMVLGGVAMTGLLGCSTGSSAPFHMYGSPLLEGEMRAQRPSHSTYDPFRLGDHEVQDTVIVFEKRNSLPQTPRTSGSERSDTAPEASSLVGASAPSGAPPAVGASEGISAESARPSAPSLATRSEKKDAEAEPAAAPTENASGQAARFVAAVYALNGVEVGADARQSIPELYRTCRQDGAVYHSSRPTVGDIVFYHNTFDANDDGRNNDWYTHVGLVESVDRNGTAAVLSYRNGKVSRHHLNLERSEASTLPGGASANSSLRDRRDDDAPFTQYLAGQLFAGFCSLLGDQAELVLVDNWQPGMNLAR